MTVLQFAPRAPRIARAAKCSYRGYEFGSGRKDSICIDGKLWDTDSECGPGVYRMGGTIPCPNCRPDEHIEWTNKV